MVYTKWLGEFAGPRTALKEKIQAIEFKISVCCLQQMGQLGLFSLTPLFVFIGIFHLFAILIQVLIEFRYVSR